MPEKLAQKINETLKPLHFGETTSRSIENFNKCNTSANATNSNSVNLSESILQTGVYLDEIVNKFRDQENSNANNTVVVVQNVLLDTQTPLQYDHPQTSGVSVEQPTSFNPMNTSQINQAQTENSIVNNTCMNGNNLIVQQNQEDLQAGVI